MHRLKEHAIDMTQIPSINHDSSMLDYIDIDKNILIYIVLIIIYRIDVKIYKKYRKRYDYI